MTNLRKLRLERGLSQQALAEKFNLSQQSIYKYENGLAEPDISTLKDLAGFFGVSIDYLVNYSPDQTALEDPPLRLTASEAETVKKLRKLPSEVTQSLIDLISRL